MALLWVEHLHAQNCTKCIKLKLDKTRKKYCFHNMVLLSQWHWATSKHYQQTLLCWIKTWLYAQSCCLDRWACSVHWCNLPLNSVTWSGRGHPQRLAIASTLHLFRTVLSVLSMHGSLSIVMLWQLHHAYWTTTVSPRDQRCLCRQAVSVCLSVRHVHVFCRNE